jgi:hypothetical protein
MTYQGVMGHFEKLGLGVITLSHLRHIFPRIGESVKNQYTRTAFREIEAVETE